MVKGLITEQYLKDIGDAIREKTGENSVYYPSEMANAIMNIPTASGGLNLNTSLVLETNKTSTTGKVTLTATLSANYDDLTPSDVDLHGFLQGATVNFYDSEGTSLASSITNENGVALAELTLYETTILYCSFNGTSDYEACESNTVTVTFVVPLYAPLLDGSESKYQITGSTTIANGEMYGGSAYLTTGWDNTENWKLTHQQLVEDGGCGVYLKLPNSTRRDYDEILIAHQGQNEGIQVWIYNGSYSISDRVTFKQFDQFNKWYNVTIIKTSNNTFTLEINDGITTLSNTYTSDILSNSQLCIGVDSWSGISHIKNIIVEPV